MVMVLNTGVEMSHNSSISSTSRTLDIMTRVMDSMDMVTRAMDMAGMGTKSGIRFGMSM